MVSAVMADRECPTCGREWQLKVEHADRIGLRKSACYECRVASAERTRMLTSLAKAIRPKSEQPKAFALALCREVDPELFFPDQGSNSRRAKAICEQCPARAACLQWAIDNREQYGIWGGATDNERRVMSGRKPRHQMRAATA